MNNIAEIPLTNGGIALVDSESLPEIVNRNWSRSPDGYACTCIGLGSRSRKKKIYLHRLINETPDGLETDHINGNRLDNRKSNLRTATRSENNRNSSKKKRNGTSTSNFKGVYWSRQRKLWIAQIRYGGKVRNLGGFIKERDAAIAYNGAASLIFGDFAFLNKI